MTTQLQLINIIIIKFFAFCGIRSTGPHSQEPARPLSRARQTQSTPSKPTYPFPRSILILRSILRHILTSSDRVQHIVFRHCPSSCIRHFPHACYTTQPYRSPRFHCSNIFCECAYHNAFLYAVRKVFCHYLPLSF